MAEEEATHGLIIKFDDVTHSFVHGYEAGIVHEKLAGAPAELVGTYHTANAVLLGRIGRHFGYDVEIHATSIPEWSDFEFRKSPVRRFAIVAGTTVKSTGTALSEEVAG